MQLCGMAVRVYEPLPRNFLPGLTGGTDLDLSNQDIADHLRLPEQPVAEVHQIGRAITVKLSFCSLWRFASSGVLIPETSAAMYKSLSF